MPIIRAEKHEKNYTIIMNDIFKEKNLSIKAKGLLALVISLPDDWKFSKKGLSVLSKDKESSIETALKELEKQFYLTRERIREKGKYNTVYTFYEVPFCKKKSSREEISRRLKTRGRQVAREKET